MFESLADAASTGYHSGNLRPCAVSLTLRYSSHVGQRLCAHVFRYVQGSRRGIVSSTPPRADFRGKNTEAPPLPVLKRFYRFGSVSAAVLLARARAPFIVELFVVRFFGESPEVVCSRLIGVATVRLPTPACVDRTCGPCTRSAMWLWSDSRRGIWKLPNFLTHFESNGSAELHDTRYLMSCLLLNWRQ